VPSDSVRRIYVDPQGGRRSPGRVLEKKMAITIVVVAVVVIVKVEVRVKPD
jgi:hypothetical protein